MTVVKAETFCFIKYLDQKRLMKRINWPRVKRELKTKIICSWTLVELKIRMDNFRDQELTSKNTRFYLKIALQIIMRSICTSKVKLEWTSHSNLCGFIRPKFLTKFLRSIRVSNNGKISIAKFNYLPNINFSQQA